MGWDRLFMTFCFLREVNGEPLGLWSIGKLTETMNWFIEDWRFYTTPRRSRGFGFSLRSGSNECLADLPGRHSTEMKIELLAMRSLKADVADASKSVSILEVWKSLRSMRFYRSLSRYDCLLPRGSCLWPCIRSWDGCQLLVKHPIIHFTTVTSLILRLQYEFGMWTTFGKLERGCIMII